jgi:hypothetical protein
MARGGLWTWLNRDRPYEEIPQAAQEEDAPASFRDEEAPKMVEG